MRISFATTRESRCGVAAYSRALVSELEKHARIELVSLDPGAVSSPARLAAVLNEADVAHIQHQYPFFGGMAVYRNWFRQALERIQVPLVVTAHELDLGEKDRLPIKTYKQWFNRRLFTGPEIDRMVVHSAEYRDRLRGLGVEPEDIRVIPMGVPSVPGAVIEAEVAKSELGLSGKKAITIFGFVVKRKGYEIALEALKWLPEDVTLLIAGSAHPCDRTGYFDALRRRIESGSLARRVKITGFVPESRLPIVMAATDVIVAPFLEISSSWSVMHAMAYRKPIIASDLPATREINERGQCLILVKAGEAEDLAGRIQDMLKDQRTLEQASASVDAYARTWSVTRCALETIAVYRELSRRPNTQHPTPNT